MERDEFAVLVCGVVVGPDEDCFVIAMNKHQGG